jgi:outer membrane protein assembly factor BamB
MQARPLRALLVAAAALAAAACASSKHSARPAELTNFVSTARIERVWSAVVGPGQPKQRLGLSLAAAGDALFAASHDGRVVAYNQATGKTLWSTNTKLELSGGPGVGQDLVVAGASHGDIVALDAATGAVKWKAYINSEILAAPYIARDVVTLRAVDGRVVALRASDGTELWSNEQSPPRLSLRGTARPIIVGDFVISGFDNGRLQALQLGTGGTAWDVIVTNAGGKTELERLNDIDTQAVVQGNDLFVVGFQGKVARIDIETGETQWSRDASSYTGLAVDADSLYISTSNGELLKLASRNGLEAWRQTLLTNRKLSRPVVLGDFIVVADYEGYVHFFNRATGEPAGRVHSLNGRVTAAPVVSGDTVFLLDTLGKVVALRASVVEAGKGTVVGPTGSSGADGARRNGPR